MHSVKTLISGGFFLLASQVAFAAVVFDSVVIDETDSKIIVKGSGFSSLITLGAGDDVFLGGVNVSADVTVVGDTEMTVDFSANTAIAVPEKGSYLLIANDDGTEHTFSAYFDAAIIAPPVVGACPCEGIWASYGSLNGKRGFGNLDPHCEYESGDASQIVVQFHNEKTSQLWVLYSDIGTDGTFPNTCGLAIDEDPVEVNELEHAECSTYLKNNYFGTGAPLCRTDIGFPPLFPLEYPLGF